MEEPFKKIVQQIFNSWTALKLAVDHSMGGSNSKQSAIDCMNYMVQYCLYEPNLHVDKIQDALEDLLDEEFETVCEDDSPKELAAILFKFTQLIKEGNLEQCELEYQKLPTMSGDWLSQCALQQKRPAQEDSTSSNEDCYNKPTAMEEDGWTKVKTRKER